MLTVSTFIRDGGDMIPIESFPPERLTKRRMEGAIEIVINSRVLVSRDTWDDIDDLWVYLVNSLVDLEKNDTSSTLYPDQPIELIFMKRGKQIEISHTHIAKKSEWVSRVEFIHSFKGAGIRFYNFLKRSGTHEDLCRRNLDRLAKIGG